MSGVSVASSAGAGVIHVHVEDGRNRSANLRRLTPREDEILLMRAMDQSNDGIAAELGISPQTVKNHMASVYAKLDVGGIVGAMHRKGWVKIR